MKKILSVALISSVALILSTGCSSAQQSLSKNDLNSAESSVLKYNPKMSSEAFLTNTMNVKKIHEAIEEAGEKSGWKITPFKSNEVIVEKTNNGETVSSTIKFYEGYLEFSNNSDTNDLKKAIKNELKKQETSL